MAPQLDTTGKVEGHAAGVCWRGHEECAVVPGSDYCSLPWPPQQHRYAAVFVATRMAEALGHSIGLDEDPEPRWHVYIGRCVCGRYWHVFHEAGEWWLEGSALQRRCTRAEHKQGGKR